MDVAAQILQGPSRKKKKRKYILFLVAKDSVNSNDARALQRAFDHVAKDMVTIRLHEPEEGLKILMLKTVDVIVIDHSLFLDEETAAEFAAELKKRRKTPIMFVTKDENKLISSYREHLALYEELDDYLISPVEVTDVLKRLKRIAEGNGRAAKRFDIRAELKVFRLNDGSELKGELIDLSMVGMGLKVNGVQLKRREQLRVIINLRSFEIFHPQFGELLKVALRIRRVALDGETLGCSLEHLTPMQIECLTSILDKANRIRRTKMLQNRGESA